MAKFDTTKQQSQYYGLSPTQGVVTPESAYSFKEGSIGDIAGIATAGIELGDQYMDVKVGEQAEQAAMEMADQYYQQSTGDFENGIDAGNQRLVTAYKSGSMNPQEFKTRMETTANRLIANTPSKADIITSRMKDVLDRTGVSSRLAMDEQLLEAQMKQQEAYFKARDKILRDKGIEPMGMNPDEVEIIYAKEMAKERTYQGFKRSNEMTAEERKLASTEMFNDALEKGSFSEIKDSIVSGLADDLRGIIDDPNKNDESKLREANDLIRASRDNLNSFLAPMEASDDPMVASFQANMETQISALEDAFSGEFSQEEIKTRISNQRSIAQDEISLDFLESDAGKNQEKIKFYSQQLDNLTKQLNILDKMGGSDKERMAITKQISDTHKYLQSLLYSDGLRSEDKAFIDNNTEYFNYLKSDLLKLAEENQIDVNKVPKTVVNALTKEQTHISSKTSVDRLTSLEVSLAGYMNVPEEQLIEMTQDKNFKGVMVDNLSFYKSAVNFHLLDKFENLESKFIQDKNTGMLYSDDPEINNELQRINTYNSIMAKVNKVDPAVQLERTIKRDFPVLSKEAQQNSITRVNDIKEWEQLKPGQKYMLPNGQIGIRKDVDVKLEPEL